MRDFLLLILADLLLAGNFAVTKGYQKREGVSAEKGLKFNVAFGFFSALLMTVLQGFRVELSLYSAAMALGFAALIVSYTLIGFRIMEHGTMALYTVFLMTGGMVVPYLWGLIFLGEPFTLLRTAGLAVIIAAVVISNSANAKFDPRQLVWCCLVFVINGFTSVVSKEHQISVAPVSTMSFVCLCGMARFVISLIALLFVKKGRVALKMEGKSALFTLGSALFSGFSSILQLTGAKSLPATVLYPIVTGGSIIFIALAGRLLFREKLSRRARIGIALCFLGTCMFL